MTMDITTFLTAIELQNNNSEVPTTKLRSQETFLR